MYGIYEDIIGAAEKALESFEETKELLEYPEVQADRPYYYFVYSKYDSLKFIKDRLSALKDVLEEEKSFTALLSEAGSDEERAAVYEEISSLKKLASIKAAALSNALCCKQTRERAYCRFKLKEASYKLGVALYNLIRSDLFDHGARIEDEDIDHTKSGVIREISFVCEGEGVLSRLLPLTGAHKVFIAQSKNEELCFAATPAARAEKIDEKDLKIDCFHSSGAGGQNVNKVETAVRVTHLPTGLTVVCQDERSQLKNKKRALETIEKRLKDKYEKSEKKRIEADICAQYSRKNTPISFDAASFTMTDTRLKEFTKVPFPLTDDEFTLYIDGLIAL